MATGWYPDPNDDSAEVYWDGQRWHGRREKLPTDPATPNSNAAPDAIAAAIGKQPTRKFWIAAIVMIAVALIVVFWVIPEVKKSQERQEFWNQFNNSACMKEKMGPPNNLDASHAMFACA